MNLYAFLGNDGVNWIDLLGKDRFDPNDKSTYPDKEGFEGAEEANQCSDQESEGIEYCGNICECEKSGTRIRTGPTKGEFGVDKNGNHYSKCDTSKVSCPDGWDKIGTYHSHTSS